MFTAKFRQAALFCSVAYLASVGFVLNEDESMTQIVWDLNNLDQIGGQRVLVIGEPKVIDSPQGKAIEFYGKQDGLLLNAHPLTGFNQFTLEVVFRPDANGLREQRFLHLQETGSENRILIETRLSLDNHWFLDTYIRSGKTDQTLYADNFIHPVGQWYQAALVFDGKEMRHYVNGVKELSRPITFTPSRQGQTSIGVRLNRVYWFKGAIRKARFTSRALAAEEFLQP